MCDNGAMDLLALSIKHRLVTRTIRRSSFANYARFCWLLVGAACLPGLPLYAAEPENAPVVVFDFESPSSGWAYYGGYEFKGAKGRCALDHEVKRSGDSSLRLEGDFTEGGSYVAAVKKLDDQVTRLSFWVKAPGVKAIGLRLKDSSDQTFQHEIPLEISDDWQQVTVEKFSEARSFGGASNDGVWHGPLRQIMIMLARNMLEDKGTAAIWIDDVACEERPEVQP